MLQLTTALLIIKEQAVVPPYEWEKLAQSDTNHNAQGVSIAQCLSLTLKKCTIQAMRNCVEWESEAFTLAVSLLDKPLVPLSLLPPSTDRGRDTSMNAKHATLLWLNS
ncbi:hypothetical protein PR202_gb11716 [Eleusine coracana subsp. coracana]|uniref:Uncharacterized protein n=1 Tax=Eleusine coracana subsp. coracana TaxID=191504 RepID=A0AAV5ENI2_ELECO|nr:hypothetical protein PR202_gb11716 [Eleusine coracana subsp. coracana]